MYLLSIDWHSTEFNRLDTFYYIFVVELVFGALAANRGDL